MQAKGESSSARNGRALSDYGSGTVSRPSGPKSRITATGAAPDATGTVTISDAPPGLIGTGRFSAAGAAPRTPAP